VLVEQTVASNRELMVGMKRDTVFGPVVAFGLGGVLVELLVQVSQLAARYPQIKEVDLNPVRVYENGYSVLDARILR
jgi:hypothetical protein